MSLPPGQVIPMASKDAVTALHLEDVDDDARIAEVAARQVKGSSPGATKCSCGNVLKGDSAFCRMCGKSRNEAEGHAQERVSGLCGDAAAVSAQQPDSYQQMRMGYKRQMRTDTFGSPGAQLMQDVETILKKQKHEMQACLESWLQKQYIKHSAGDAAAGMPGSLPNTATFAERPSLEPTSTGSATPKSFFSMTMQTPRSRGSDFSTKSSAPSSDFSGVAVVDQGSRTIVFNEDAARLCDCGTALLPDGKCGAGCMNRRPSLATKHAATVCACGNVFAKDSKFCRKCGKARPREKKQKRGKGKFAGQMDLIVSDAQDHAKSHQSFLQWVTKSHYYEWTSATLILLNAAFIGWETQDLSVNARDRADANEPQEADIDSAFVVIGLIFAALFTVELVLRWAGDGFFRFFRTADSSWNMMDLFVVTFGIIDGSLELFVDEESKGDLGGNVAVVRMLRIIRIVRVARVIRVMKFFRELRIMIFSIIRSMKSLLWILTVLGTIFFVFGVCFTAATIAHLKTTEDWQAKENDSLRYCFGTLDRTLLTLLMAMSGGDDWNVYYEAVEPLGMHYRLLFLFFVAFSLFAVLNIVTGVFVDSAKQSNHVDREVLVQEEMEAKKAYLKRMQKMFEEIDADDTGNISKQEFERKLGDDRVIAYFSAMKLDVSDASKLFELIDYDGSDVVDRTEFLEGCYKLQGESRRADIVFMQQALENLRDTVAEMKEIFQDQEMDLRSIQHQMEASHTMEMEVCDPDKSTAVKAIEPPVPPGQILT